MEIRGSFQRVAQWLHTSGLGVLLLILLTLAALRIARSLSIRMFTPPKRDKVVEVIKQPDEEWRQDHAFREDILEPIEILGPDQFADSAVILRSRTKTKAIRPWAVGLEFKRLLKKKFDEKNIEITCPYLSLYMGPGQAGSFRALQRCDGQEWTLGIRLHTFQRS